jgi:NAD+ synthase
MQAERVRDYIVNWLREYRQNSGTKGFVVGVSGGIDSAVTSALAARTGAPVLLLEMPIHQHPAQVSRAREHIQQLCTAYPNVSEERVELSAVFESFIAAMPAVPNEAGRAMALVNSRARLRMTTLYYFAGMHGYLVAGTGNKIEDFGVGFFTKYGDGGVDLSPIADLLKSEVYELGAVLGVNEAIMQAAPTDGLWGDDRSDEDQIGASYPELEWAMKVVGEERETERETGFTERQKEVLAIYRRMNKANRHKMEAIPVCVIPMELKG